VKKRKPGRPPKPPEERFLAYRFTLPPSLSDDLDFIVETADYPSRSAALAALIRREAKRLRARESGRS
jgi:metal-responsive CopG/Arc/MetJ family transcriptional regulator